MEPTMDKKSNGALIGAIIVLLILILGGIYVWNSNSLNDKDSGPIPVNNEQSSLGDLNTANAIDADLSSISEENNAGDVDFTADVNLVQ